jgi:ATP phosphoribosyltransferase
MFAPVARLLRDSGVPIEDADGIARELALDRGDWRLLFTRSRDVSLFVEHGVAAVGVAGKDTLLEDPRPVVEVLDLGIGLCRLVIAARAGVGPIDLRAVRRVATKYPRLTGEYLSARGIDAQILVMHGAVESAPGLGLADAIVDLVQTGSTLEANGLIAVDTILASTARLIVNPVAYRLRTSAFRDWMEVLRCLCA